MKMPPGVDAPVDWVPCTIKRDQATFAERFGKWPSGDIGTIGVQSKSYDSRPANVMAIPELLALIIITIWLLSKGRNMNKLTTLKSLPGVLDKTLGMIENEAQKMVEETTAMGEHGVATIQTVRGKVKEARDTFNEVAKAVTEDPNTNGGPPGQGSTG